METPVFDASRPIAINLRTPGGVLGRRHCRVALDQRLFDGRHRNSAEYHKGIQKLAEKQRGFLSSTSGNLVSVNLRSSLNQIPECLQHVGIPICLLPMAPSSNSYRFLDPTATR
jgi:hypothetical protein